MDFINLTNGLACLPHVEMPRYMRLQSTWCEQKRWDDVLVSLPSDLYMALAVGEEITVHDVSEKPRRTRACWQGLNLVRVACALNWGLPLPEVVGRGGKSLQQYLIASSLLLSERTQTALRYYRHYLSTPTLIINVCDGAAANKPQEGSNAGVTRDVPVRGIDRGVGCGPAAISGQADAAQSQLTTASGGARTVGVVGDACPAAAKDRPLSGTQQDAGR